MMALSVEEINIQLVRLSVKKEELQNRRKELKSELERIEKSINIDRQCEDILRKSIQAVHQIFKSEIEEIITKAIQKIFNRDLSFELIYEEKRNSVNTRIVIRENGEILEPKDDLGGSVIEIISFSFRIIMWQMSVEKSRNTFILDEPFNWTGKLAQITGLILKEMANKFNLQVILVTHNDDLISIADKLFKIDYIDGESHVKIIRKEEI